ncbi:MAG: alpha/beta fold hydrolase [Micropruina sp.]|uniref:alpha/beta hydrolase n=1 Tax=Micropruina sp. TaxID=2737536 RepID=UPI0039E2925A
MITAAAIAALAFAATWVWLWRRSRFAWVPSTGRPDESRDCGTVRTVHFPAVDGTRLEGWLFQPVGTTRPPVVIMAPGLGGTKDGFLEPFAWAFVARGLAVLAFDYRCFGGSDGTPRHWVAPPRHREDYAAAMEFVRSGLVDVDAARIALWGSSFSGGNVLVTAARNPGARAVVAQCPHLKTPEHLQPRGFALARFVCCAVLDMLRILPPLYVPLFGRPGEWVFAPSFENPSVRDFHGPLGSDFWRRLPKPPLGGWENRMLARGLATLDEVVPMDELATVRCHVLFVAAQHDDMVPSAFIQEAHRRLPGSELSSYDCGHFGLYTGPAHAENAQRQADFLARTLSPGPPT